MTINYETVVCCFCLQPVIRTSIDPLEIGVRSIGTDADPETGPQGLYSHQRCLRQRVASQIPLVGDED
jgi:hypothetical protein